MELKTSVFATSNNIEKIIIPLQSRFFIVNMQAYTYEQFYQIAVRILTSSRYQVDGEIAEVITQTVWTTSKNIRDCIKIAGMAKSVEDVKWLDYVLKNDTVDGKSSSPGQELKSDNQGR